MEEPKQPGSAATTSSGVNPAAPVPHSEALEAELAALEAILPPEKRAEADPKSPGPKADGGTN
jgi:hypothetical protein